MECATHRFRLLFRVLDKSCFLLFKFTSVDLKIFNLVFEGLNIVWIDAVVLNSYLSLCKFVFRSHLYYLPWSKVEHCVPSIADFLVRDALSACPSHQAQRVLSGPQPSRARVQTAVDQEMFAVGVRVEHVRHSLHEALRCSREAH